MEQLFIIFIRQFSNETQDENTIRLLQNDLGLDSETISLISDKIIDLFQKDEDDFLLLPLKPKASICMFKDVIGKSSQKNVEDQIKETFKLHGYN
jgi:hypothetical protein